MIEETPSEREAVDCLHLEIHKNSCRCGNKWDSSYPILGSQVHGYLGGTPSPMQSHALPVKSMSETLVSYDHCFRCVPLALGKNWVSPIKLQLIKEGETFAAKRRAFEEELLS